jgi:hypothetical protein
LAEERGDAFGVEALAKQVAVNATEDGGVAQLGPMSQATLQRLLQQLRLINLREYFGDGLAGDLPRDAERFDLADDTRPAAALDAHLRARAGERGAPVVERALAPQARDGVVYVMWFEFAAGEPLAHLRLGEFAAGEERQAGDIRPLGAIGHRRPNVLRIW